MTRRDLFKFAALAPVAALAAKLKKPEPEVVLITIPPRYPGPTRHGQIVIERDSDNLSMAEMEMAFRKKWFKEPKYPYTGRRRT